MLVTGEIRRGVERIRRRDPDSARHLDTWLKRLCADFGDRILPITSEIADTWGALCPAEPLPPIDGLLAATALVHDLMLVTRNESDVRRAGIRFLNPFSPPK